jgi:hypothetical protein
MPKTIMATVVLDEMGRLTATVNSSLEEQQKVVLACQCAEMFARLAAQAVMAQEMDNKPKILVPHLTGLKL